MHRRVHTHSFTATALIKPFLLHGESEGAKLGAYGHFKILGRQQTDIWTNELIRSESDSGSDLKCGWKSLGYPVTGETSCTRRAGPFHP